MPRSIKIWPVITPDGDEGHLSACSLEHAVEVANDFGWRLKDGDYTAVEEHPMGCDYGPCKENS